MTRYLILALGIWSALAGALEGGNSSGGEEMYGAGSLPFEANYAFQVGVVDTVSGSNPARVGFRKLFKGTDKELDVAPSRQGAPSADTILFVRNGKANNYVGRTVDLTAEREKAVEEYFADNKDDARLQWSLTYGKSQDQWLHWSAELVAEGLARGAIKNKVLAALLSDSQWLAPTKRYSLLSNFLPDADAERVLKETAVDAKLPFNSRRQAANAFFHRAQDYKTLIEAWKDGKDGADSWLQRIAQECWNTFFSPKPVATDADIAKLKAELADPSTRQKAIFKVNKFHGDNRTAWLLADTARDKTASAIDRQFAMSELKEMKAVMQIVYIALDSTVERNIRSAAILEIGLTGDQDMIQILIRDLGDDGLKKEAEVFLKK